MRDGRGDHKVQDETMKVLNIEPVGAAAVTSCHIIEDCRQLANHLFLQPRCVCSLLVCFNDAAESSRNDIRDLKWRRRRCDVTITSHLGALLHAGITEHVPACNHISVGL